MTYRALITDYDGTIAHAGIVDVPTAAALKQVRNMDLVLILATGRELSSLLNTFPESDVFDRIVAENGAALYTPSTKSIEILGSPPPVELVRALQQLNVPMSVGHSIVATTQPYLPHVHDVLKRLAVPWHVVLNKDAVMILPSTVDKATGVSRALADLGISPPETIGIGDAENDVSFLQNCGLAVAVANALPAVKSRVDFVTAGSRGAGVCELIGRLLGDDAMPRRR